MARRKGSMDQTLARIARILGYAETHPLMKVADIANEEGVSRARVQQILSNREANQARVDEWRLKADEWIVTPQERLRDELDALCNRQLRDRFRAYVRTL